MDSNIRLIIGGMVIFLIGLIVAGVINSVAASTGVAANLGSFAGAQSINDLFPTLFYIGLMVAGLSAMGVGTARAIRN